MLLAIFVIDLLCASCLYIAPFFMLICVSALLSLLVGLRKFLFDDW